MIRLPNTHRPAAFLAAGVLALAASPAGAIGLDLNNLQNLSQGQFHDLAEDLGAALSYKPLEPADNLGVTGVDLGLALSATPLANSSAVQAAVTNSSLMSTVPVPTVRATLGLPHQLDLGVLYSRVPASPINLWGADLKWAFMKDGLSTPAIALRGSVTRVDGVNQLGFETVGVDLSVSKSLLVVTPYAGVGGVWSRTAADGLVNHAGVALQQENIAQAKVFAGCGFNLGLMNLVIEADDTGNIPSYSAKIGVRF